MNRIITIVLLAAVMPFITSHISAQQLKNPENAGEVKTVVGKVAPDFELSTPNGQKIRLSETVKTSPVVVVVLRGYPGYQCPICTQQVAELIKNQKELADANGRVLLIYPAPQKLIEDKAKEFFANSELPKHFTVLLDPDLGFVNAHGLRWNAPNETAYPSTIIVDKTGIVRFLHVSKTHGARVSSKEMVRELKKLN
jgi:peroxiredoxin